MVAVKVTSSGAPPVDSVHQEHRLSLPLVVTIDGGAGTGKSTLGADLARRRGLPFIDSGQWYRALAAYAIQVGVSTTDEESVLSLCRTLVFRCADPVNPGRCTFISQSSGSPVEITFEAGQLDGLDVASAASGVSRIPEVRRLFNARQQELLASGGVTVGRRQGDEVFGADFEQRAGIKVARLFLWVSPDVVADRRATQLNLKGGAEAVAKRLAARDEADMNRPVAPALGRDEAVELGFTVIDNSGRSLEEAKEFIASLVEGATRDEAVPPGAFDAVALPGRP